VVPTGPLKTVTLRNILVVILLAVVALVSTGWSTRHLLNRETRVARRLQEAGLAGDRSAPSTDARPWFDDDAATKAWAPEEVDLALPQAEIARDAEGRAVLITAGDPLQVLEAFCALHPSGSRQSLGLAEADLAGGASTFGLFQDSESEGSPRAIKIRRDSRSRRWSAGDGRGPVATFPADAVLMAASHLQADTILDIPARAAAPAPALAGQRSGPRLGWGTNAGRRAPATSSGPTTMPASPAGTDRAR
jgi:hypothetical protein